MKAYSYLRFSSAEQRKGDSLRRQIDLRDRWLAKKGIPLDTAFVLPPDQGVSAFRGKNAVQGNLKAFLDAVRSGRIKPGSYLIMENLDRLSRDELQESLALFLEIIRAGIILVTLAPEREFARGVTPWQLMEVLVELGRANSESVAKSERATAAWQHKRTLLDQQPLTGKVPSWLQKIDGKLVLNADKVQIVRRAFQLCLEGLGSEAIARRFRTEQIPPLTQDWKRSALTGWVGCSVHHLLTNRECIGEFQPMTRNPDFDARDPARAKLPKRIPAGPAVKDYFPRVVSDETFFVAQQAIQARKSRGPGRGYETVLNLFTGLVEDRHGAHYVAFSSRGHAYLRTEGARLDNQILPRIPYPTFERVLLRWLTEVKVDLTEAETDVLALQAEVQNLDWRIKLNRAKIKELGLESLYEVQAQLEAEHKLKSRQLEQALIPKQNQMSHTQSLVRQLEAVEGEERLALRLQIKQQLKMVLDKIIIESIKGRLGGREKRIVLRVVFSNGQERRLWYETDRNGILVGEGLLFDPHAGTNQVAVARCKLFEVKVREEGDGPVPRTTESICQMLRRHYPDHLDGIMLAEGDLEDERAEGAESVVTLSTFINITCPECRRRLDQYLHQARGKATLHKIFDLDETGGVNFGHVWFGTTANQVNLCQAKRLQAEPAPKPKRKTATKKKQKPPR